MSANKILIAEDERPMARALMLKLQHEGMDVTVVHDGQAAVDILQQQSFDVLVLDLIMPNKDGFEVLTELQKKPPQHVPAIIVASNLGQEEDIKRARELGAKDFLVKSNTPVSAVVDKIKQLLKK